MDTSVDGMLSIEDQATTIKYAENIYNEKLVDYRTGTEGMNFATLASVPLGETIPDLELVSVADETSIGTVVADRLAQGKHLIFYNTILVAGTAAKVAGFR